MWDMNIRSIDLQVLIPKTAEVAKIQQNINQQPAIAQEEFAAIWQQVSSDNQRKIQKAPSSEGGKINRGNEHSRKQSENETDNQQELSAENKNESNAKEQTDPVRGHHIDISL